MAETASAMPGAMTSHEQGTCPEQAARKLSGSIGSSGRNEDRMRRTSRLRDTFVMQIDDLHARRERRKLTQVEGGEGVGVKCEAQRLTLEWGVCFNGKHLLSLIGFIPPVKPSRTELPCSTGHPFPWRHRTQTKQPPANPGRFSSRETP